MGYYSRPGRARTQVQFVPRALKKAPNADPSQPSTNEQETQKPGLSNDDFRKMFKWTTGTLFTLYGRVKNVAFYNKPSHRGKVVKGLISIIENETEENIALIALIRIIIWACSWNVLHVQLILYQGWLLIAVADNGISI